MTHIKNGQAANAQAYQRGIERVHERLDSQNGELSTIKASVENVAASAKTAVKEGLQDQKIWIYGQALAIAGTLLLFILKEFLLK